MTVRRYACGTTYTPVAPEDRRYGINKPDDPRAVRFHTKWFLPLEVAPDEQRVMPETRPDTLAWDHRDKTRRCKCEVCLRPEAQVWRTKEPPSAFRD